MTERSKRETELEGLKDRVTHAKNFLCGYQLCLDMLHLRRYERNRTYHFEADSDCGDLLAGNEALWRARMYEVRALVDSMKNGREKLIIYYHYIRGESIERAADLLGCSRRTGYRLHKRGLLTVSALMERVKRQEER